ncbi:MAG: twin-arginine translocase TatA/TatE family subunit [Atopobiaceae bacterium]|nr:twin-arginine translocase TatA/TatE family subunit [Atopobiaceae bacterium]MCH4180228.1 twin-arginine translocase TatA/TatE family subunit [Atopobiaceae bacterium]MCH4214398.1 twin-arginine translocase TatA/TatE family subunit [Atopobiaceae bacterium]MCH4229171.1 twin-arginine translocase TatA/TatE family subunit [Atopobiaceae bacterium]MCH4276542.1 twin-arginine translocase TatA/TatE family subunit [Atopobiaceae bacterium]
MFGIGETELALILVFAFLLFGPDKLPAMGRTIGRMLRQFRTAQEGFTKVVQTEVIDPMNSASNDPDSKVAKVVGGDDDDAPAPRDHPSETFAERRARLEAERGDKATKADEPVSPDDAADTTSASAVAADVDDADAMTDDQTTAAKEAAEAEERAKAEAEEAERAADERRRSAAALYGLDDVPEPAPASDPDVDAADDAPATPADDADSDADVGSAADAAPTTDPGKEDEDA